MDSPRAAVIGSGFGGLAAAIRLQAGGIQTVLFEARDQPGGRAHVYHDDGFVFDAGPTVITAPHTIDELFALAGKKREDYIELLPVIPFYRLVFSDGAQIDYAGGDTLLEQIRARYPEDAAGYQRFVEYSRRVFEKGYAQLVHEPFLRFADMLRVGPDLLRLRADQSVYRAVSRFVRDEHLRQALSFHSLLIGGNPFDTSAIYTLIHYLENKWGVFFPRGGTSALVGALARLFEGLGGELRLSCPVDRITVDLRTSRPRHEVVSRCATPQAFDLVVSNADIHHTYAHLYRGHPWAARMARRLSRATWSMSLFVVYFGTDRGYDLAHHTILFGPRYRDLLRDIFRGPSLPDDFSLYLHAPTVTDPSLAPKGSAVFYVLSPVPHLGKASIDWKSVAPTYADRILGFLEGLMPGLREHIVRRRLFTPEDFRDRLFAFQGSAFSVAPTLTQSAWFRPHNRDSRIPGLYIVGAGTHPGAGVPGVLNGAKASVGLALQDFGLGPGRAPRGSPGTGVAVSTGSPGAPGGVP
jgi:phytoene desaturase